MGVGDEVRTFLGGTEGREKAKKADNQGCFHRLG
jgi:hypothetical protein